MPKTVPKDSDPEALTDNKKVAGLMEVLQWLPLPRPNARGHPTGSTHCLVSLDRGVRDYLVSAI